MRAGLGADMGGVKPPIYAGIGSRETPDAICSLMTRIAEALRDTGWLLRSGAARGADEAFEAGAGDAKEIWLPWKGFRGHASTLVPSPEAFRLAAQYHPAWHACSPAAKALHARNGHQALGLDLQSPVAFVAAWTHKGCGQGGTGQAIRIARAYGIPVFDLGGDLDLALDGIAQHAPAIASEITRLAAAPARQMSMHFT